MILFWPAQNCASGTSIDPLAQFQGTQKFSKFFLKNDFAEKLREREHQRPRPHADLSHAELRTTS